MNLRPVTRRLTHAGDVERPHWLNASVHLYNTAAAWGDLVTSRRTFSKSSEKLSSVLVFGYLCYIQLCRHMNGCVYVMSTGVCGCACGRRPARPAAAMGRSGAGAGAGPAPLRSAPSVRRLRPSHIVAPRRTPPLPPRRHYPYPFLRNLKQPHGFIGTATAGLLLFAGAFRVGKAINRRVRAVSLTIAGDSDAITIRAAKAEAHAARPPRVSFNGHYAYAFIRRRTGGGGGAPRKAE